MSKARDLGDSANKANFLDNVTSDIQGQIDGIPGVPAGFIMPFGGTTAPTGYLACEGQEVLQSDYPDLYAAIGTTWNTGPTGSYFKLPDLRGAFLRGTGTHGISANNMANGSDFAGPSVGSFEDDQMQNHKHSIYSSISGATGTGSGAVNYAASSPGTFEHYPYSSEMAESNHPSADGTPRAGDETRPFNAGILYCIKT